MRRKISAIIISIILSIVGIIPTTSITYAVSNDTVEEICVYRTSVKHEGVSEPNYWSFVSTLVAYDNGHIRMDVQCVTCGGRACNEIGSIQFSDNMIAPVGTTGYGGISTFKPKNSYSKYLTSYTTQDIIYTLTYSDSNYYLSGATLMSFDLYVKEPYLNTNQKIIFFGNEIEIPFEKELGKTSTETTTTTTTTKTTTMTTTVTTTETLPNVVSKAAEIKINNLPEKVTYEVGEPLDLKGGTYSAEAKVLYSNGAQPSNKKDNVSMTAKDQYVYIDYNYAMAHWGHIFNLAVDTSAVNMNKAGTYPVYVKAVDNDDDKLVYDSKSFNINVNETTTTTTKPVPSTNKYILGDVNGDGSVDGTDAGMVLREYAVLPEDRTFTEAQIKAGDINNDGSIDASDAGDILRYFAEKGAGYEGDDMELWLQSLHYCNGSTN